MNKQEFVAMLRNSLCGLPQEDIERSVEFYCEMIDDRVEEGLTETAAVCELGSAEEVVSQIMSEIPLSRLVKERVKPGRSLRVWEIILLILGSPLWLIFVIVAFVAVLSVYIIIWSAVISLWAVEFSVIGCFLGAVLSCFIFVFQGSSLAGIAMLGAGLVCIGLSVLLFLGCRQITKGVLLLTKKILFGLKAAFIRKGEVK